MDYDYNILEQKFKELPESTQAVLTSPQVIESIKSIAEKNGLLIDQMSTLFDLTSYVLLGLLSSNQFVNTLSKETGITEPVAKVIADEINQEVFAKIRTSMRETEEKQESDNKSKPTHITDLEKAGSFTIENETGPMVKNNIPSNPIRFNNPNIPTEKPINMPAEEPINTPVEITQNEIPVPVKTPVQESIVTPIPETTSVPVSPILTETIVPVNKPISESLSAAVHESITEMLPESTIIPLVESIPVPEPVPEVHKEPLADQLLSALNKNPSKAPAPVNLPISGEEIATTSKDKPKSSDQYREPLG
jgi:hypothetical protein